MNVHQLCRYREITSSISSPTCQAYVKQILCQACSPYAAHLYGFEDTGEVSPLPGLCFPHCSRVLSSCGATNLAKLSTDRKFRASLNVSGAKFGVINGEIKCQYGQFEGLLLDLTHSVNIEAIASSLNS